MSRPVAGSRTVVKLCQALGCSLDEIATLLGPGAGPARPEVAGRKLHELEATLARMRTAQAVLAHFAACEHTEGDADQCRDTVRSAMHDLGSSH